MSEHSVTRRDILKTLTLSAVGGSVLQVIPAKAAEYAHQLVHNEKAGSAAGKYAPKYFSPHQYEMLTALCDTIIPKDEKSGGAVEAGAPEFIDLLTSENEKYQLDARRRADVAGWFLHRPLRESLSGLHSGAAEAGAGPYRFPKKCEAGSIAKPGRSLFRFLARDDLRRLLHQQNRHRGFAVHREHRSARIPRLPSGTGGVVPTPRRGAASRKQLFFLPPTNACAVSLPNAVYSPLSICFVSAACSPHATGSSERCGPLHFHEAPCTRCLRSAPVDGRFGLIRPCCSYARSRRWADGRAMPGRPQLHVQKTRRGEQLRRRQAGHGFLKPASRDSCWRHARAAFAWTSRQSDARVRLPFLRELAAR